MKLKDLFYFLVVSIVVVFLLIIYVSERSGEDVEPFVEINPVILSNSECTDRDNTDEIRYLAYLPHGTFHEQRMSLENALFLAWATNRTLLLPPIIFGRETLMHKPSYRLHKDLIALKLYNESNSQCAWDSEHAKCTRKVQSELYTLVSWDILLDMKFLNEHVRSVSISRESSDFPSLYSSINITDLKNQAFFIHDRGPYYYQFYDDVKESKPSDSEYEHMVHLCTLQRRNEPLLHFGSLSGINRLNLKLDRNKEFLKESQEHILINHPEVLNAAELITIQLGGLASYLGVHINLLDHTSDDSAESIINKLVEEITEQLTNVSPEARNDTLSTRSFQPTSTQILASTCMESLPPEKRYFPIIYLSTNLMRSDHRLSRFFEEFPCVFMLSDFQSWNEPLKNITNPMDNVELFEFLLPLVDIIVVAKSGQIFEAEDGTFNDYVQRLHEIWV